MTSVTRNNQSLNTTEQPFGARLVHHASATAAFTLLALLPLTAGACASGADLERPHQEYLTPSGGVTTAPGTTAASVGGATGTTMAAATATTGASTNCTDQEVDALFFQKCSSSLCHGDPGGSPGTDTNLFLFSPGRKTEMLRPGVDCPDEAIIDVNNPGASLLITTLRRTAACGIAMPIGPALKEEEIACIEGWVNDVVANAAGVVTEPAVGGSSAF